MENKNNVISADIPAEVKLEPEENQISLTNETPNEIKIEPLDDQAESSSVRIANSFPIPFPMPVDTNSVKTEEEEDKKDDSTEPDVNIGDEAGTNLCDIEEEIFMKQENGINLNSLDIKVEINVKKECPSEVTPSTSCQLATSGDIKKENEPVVIKSENESSSLDQNTNSCNVTTPSISPPPIDTVQANPPTDANAIAKILTTSVPCSSSNCDQTDDVSSSTDPQKPPCRYGKSCYRLNEQHRKNFSHPPGSDPHKSPEKPRCKYGSRCYRKSEDHRKRFIHDRSPDNALSNTRKRKVRNAGSQTTSHVYESDSDDDSYEEYDGTSDEFHPDDESDSDETDFDDDTDDQILLNIG